MHDDNLPPQLANDSEFNNEPELKMKVCPDCHDGIHSPECLTCRGQGEIPMTFEEIRQEIYDKKEYNSIKNQ